MELNYPNLNSVNSATVYVDRQGPTTPASPIRSQYGQLEQGLDGLSERIDSLECKLQAVLSPNLTMPGETAMPATGESPASLSPFADSIRSDSERVQRLIAHLSDIIARLEL